MSDAPAWLLPLVVALWLALLSWLELRVPLRASVEPKLRRIARNLVSGGLATAVSLPLQLALLTPLIVVIESERIGLLHLLAPAPWLATVLAVVLLDATLWPWHWLNHRVPFLWRFHLVHHTDRDMDASTGLRFHAGELALSVGYRALQLTLIGPAAADVALWSALLVIAVLFHHANLRLPWSFERVLAHVIVTPRYHDLHHATRAADRNANYASLLSLWDRLGGTSRPLVRDAATTIGVPGYMAPSDSGFMRMQRLPFEAPREPTPRAPPPSA